MGNVADSYDYDVLPATQVPESKLLSFRLVDSSVVKTIIQREKFTYCNNDPLPMSDISGSENFDEILPIMTDLVNKSIERNIFRSLRRLQS